MSNPKDVSPAAWRTSSYSTGGNQCVEVGALPTGDVAVRDSKNRAGGTHVIGRTAWIAFTNSIKTDRL